MLIGFFVNDLEREHADLPVADPQRQRAHEAGEAPARHEVGAVVVEQVLAMRLGALEPPTSGSVTLAGVWIPARDTTALATGLSTSRSSSTSGAPYLS